MTYRITTTAIYLIKPRLSVFMLVKDNPLASCCYCCYIHMHNGLKIKKNGAMNKAFGNFLFVLNASSGRGHTIDLRQTLILRRQHPHIAPFYRIWICTVLCSKLRESNVFVCNTLCYIHSHSYLDTHDRFWVLFTAVVCPICRQKTTAEVKSYTYSIVAIVIQYVSKQIGTLSTMWDYIYYFLPFSENDLKSILDRY